MAFLLTEESVWENCKVYYFCIIAGEKERNMAKRHILIWKEKKGKNRYALFSDIRRRTWGR